MKQAIDLMKARVKLEIRYPHYPFDGDVLLVDEQGELYHETEGYPQSIYKILESDIQNCKCFRMMNWWEERKPEEMPEYVKFTNGYMDFKKGSVYKTTPAIKSDGAGIYIYFLIDGNNPKQLIDNKVGVPPNFNQLLPATEAEYQNFLKSKS